MFADGGGIGGEAAAPEGVADHGDVLAAGLVFCFGEGAPERRLDAQNIEEIPGDARPAKLLGRAATGEREGFVGESGQPREGTVVSVHLLEAEPGERPLPHTVELARFGDQDKAIGLAIRQRAQQQSVGDAKDGRVGADPDSQCENRHGKKNGALDEKPQGVANVLPESGHLIPF